eukprot:UN0702
MARPVMARPMGVNREEYASSSWLPRRETHRSILYQPATFVDPWVHPESGFEAVVKAGASLALGAARAVQRPIQAMNAEQGAAAATGLGLSALGAGLLGAVYHLGAGVTEEIRRYRERKAQAERDFQGASVAEYDWEPADHDDWDPPDYDDWDPPDHENYDSDDADVWIPGVDYPGSWDYKDD